mmetsp:Transcript_10416/g.31615  ORF Transcript_10416/g.31615 Transcript_10416/m.31615 type:complete len:313 (+) Transcript_10416:422-1360(+)
MATFSFFLRFFSPHSQRWQNLHSTPLMHPFCTKAHGLHSPTKWPAEPMLGKPGGQESCTPRPSARGPRSTSASRTTRTSGSGAAPTGGCFSGSVASCAAATCLARRSTAGLDVVSRVSRCAAIATRPRPHAPSAVSMEPTRLAGHECARRSWKKSSSDGALWFLTSMKVFRTMYGSARAPSGSAAKPSTGSDGASVPPSLHWVLGVELPLEVLRDVRVACWKLGFSGEAGLEGVANGAFGGGRATGHKRSLGAGRVGGGHRGGGITPSAHGCALCATACGASPCATLHTPKAATARCTCTSNAWSAILRSQG